MIHIEDAHINLTTCRILLTVHPFLGGLPTAHIHHRERGAGWQVPRWNTSMLSNDACRATGRWDAGNEPTDLVFILVVGLGGLSADEWQRMTA